MISPLSDALDEGIYGGKAAGLSKLIGYGAKVPPGFAISKQVLQESEEQLGISKVYVNVIGEQLQNLSSELVMVRSSAVGEDGENYSYAGQLDSFAVENSIDQVIEGIMKCWNGLNNERVKAYGELTGRTLSEMGVVVQEFIEPDYAGVLFTCSPLAGDGIYAEYVEGRGEQLVSGEFTPTIIDLSQDESCPFSVKELFDRSIDLKNKYAHDLDIEWVWKDGQFYFVQARPITTATRKKVHWTNTNLNENYPDPISPLLYSIARDSYYHYFKNLAGLLQLSPRAIRDLEYDFSNTVGIWGNRIYYNMSSIHNIMASSPLKSYFIDAFNKFVGYKDEDVTDRDQSRTTSTVKLVWRLIRLNFGLEENVHEIEEMVTQFSADTAVRSRSDAELFYTFLDLRFHQWYRASLADFFAMIHYKLLAVFTRRFYGAEAVGVHNKLVQAIPDLISMEPVCEIYDLSKFIQNSALSGQLFKDKDPRIIWKKISEEDTFSELRLRIEDYLGKWGFRCSGELMFFKSNYVDEPWKFIELLQAYLSQEAKDPREVLRLKAQERKQARAQFMGKIIRKRHVFFPVWIMEIFILRLLVKLCMQAISSRERVRYKQAEMYFRFKEVVKRIGGEDAFYLSYKEIGEMIASSSMGFSELKEVAERKILFVKESEKVFPEHFSTFFGERPDFVSPEIVENDAKGVFSGLAASGGRLQGRVKVLESVLESDKLERGDILVTRQTDPGWAMVFPIIAGLIVERGGALSHGAIVAREFGIPAVVGVSGITEKLQDGDIVILDGDLGKVQKITS